MSISSGFVAAGFEPVREAFEANFEAGLENGAGFAAWIGDERIVDLVGGTADRSGRPWDVSTICPVFSTTKPIAALVIALLVERGRIDYEAPVARYWAEFGVEGKDKITVAEALSHQAGLPGFPDPIDPALWIDPPRLAAELATLAPMWAVGEGTGYHPLTWGYIAGELARRADGRTLGAILHEEICGPLGLDFWIGLPPAELPRMAKLQKPSESTRFAEKTPALQAAFLTPWAAPTARGPEWAQAEIPSANGIGDAASVARLYSAYALKGRIGERRLISAATWDKLTRERISGPDRVLPGRISFAAGVMRNDNRLYGPNPDTLWHSGWGGSGAFGDPGAGLSAAYVMNRQGTHPIEDARRQRLIDALYRCL